MKLAALLSCTLSLALSLALSVATGCGAHSPSSPSPLPSASAPAAAPSPQISDEELARQTAFVDRLIGGWLGAGSGPFGEMPFAVVFERQADGSARAWADDGKGTQIDLWLQRGELGGKRGWLLRESATLPNVGTQTYTLVIAAGGAKEDGDRLRFHHPDRPGFLDIELALTPGQLQLTAAVHGKPHVDFAMRRLPDGAIGTLLSRLHAPGTSVPAVQAAPASSASTGR